MEMSLEENSDPGGVVQLRTKQELFQKVWAASIFFGKGIILSNFLFRIRQFSVLGKALLLLQIAI
eukprot:CAMPEP_0170490062 /NCGR_PEP_ID=MMETSP0208-20121228/8339_1 /TAXON_ID=197538 /ORGANISM="Strombidium inclinatum, Strain S3" /LENGTH=64 /DNA_ID=CAMNT_0010765287 /DNA_START=243 /DNA_END=437 /DNA_ORIENTATION=+